ncbi:hypothetical protein CEXT_110681, partial [Caerostris extrusa]
MLMILPNDAWSQQSVFRNRCLIGFLEGRSCLLLGKVEGFMLT